MRKRVYAVKRLNKLKRESWNPSSFDYFEDKVNMLFKSNGIYCSCRTCKKYRYLNKKYKAFKQLKADSIFKFEKENMSDY